MHFSSGDQPDPCEHGKTLTDSETGQTVCEICGLELIEKPVPIGSHLVPPEEFMRRVRIKCQELDLEILQSQQRKHQLLSAAAKVRDVRCRWLGCEVPPMLRSKWCPIHLASSLRKFRQRKRKCGFSKCNRTYPRTRVTLRPHTGTSASFTVGVLREL